MQLQIRNISRFANTWRNFNCQNTGTKNKRMPLEVLAARVHLDECISVFLEARKMLVGFLRNGSKCWIYHDLDSR